MKLRNALAVKKLNKFDISDEKQNDLINYAGLIKRIIIPEPEIKAIIKYIKLFKI